MNPFPTARVRSLLPLTFHFQVASILGIFDHLWPPPHEQLRALNLLDRHAAVDAVEDRVGAQCVNDERLDPTSRIVASPHLHVEDEDFVLVLQCTNLLGGHAHFFLVFGLFR